MSLTWLPSTTSGVMVGDYVAAAFSNGQPHAVFAVANAKAGSTFHEAIYTPTNALSQSNRSTHPAMRPDAAVTRAADHPPRRFYDLDHEHPIPRRKK